MNRLKAYIRETVLASAVEYAYPRKRRTAESTLAAFRDYAHGTDIGTWSGLIYTADVLELFNRYRGDVRAAVLDYLDEAGLGVGNAVDPREAYGHTWADVIVATARRQTWAHYTGEEPRSREADAATFGIRFACEYLLPAVASECGVDL